MMESKPFARRQGFLVPIRAALWHDRHVATLTLIFPECAELGKEFPVPIHGVVVGRDTSCAIHVDSDSISRRHARIYFTDDQWMVEDLQSTNGCFVNHVQVQKSVLRDDDALKVGNVIFKFHATGAFEIPSRDEDDEGGSGGPAEITVPRPKRRD